ncbi:MAG: rhamnan synthesis F family protein [Ancrocorticia sp.]|nr:rhamnan synthesis F family protein [Ancrocorticia sp.]MCI2001582.1 rhamnan synthesis F family protein [Ancrocorticia sp.]
MINPVSAGSVSYDANVGSLRARRLVVFLHHDADGICDQSVLRVLQSLRSYASRFVVVANGGLKASARMQLEKIIDEVIERPNIGFDVGAYTEALRSVGWSHLAEFDELLLVNNTFFGPVSSFDPLFERMSHDNVDFWGMTNHPAVSPNPFTGRGVMPEHLQSYWLLIRKTILRDPSFERYWQSLPMPQSYNDVVVNFESQFTQYFSERGFTWAAAYRAEDYGVLNPSMEAPLALLKDGCPIFKKRLYFHDVPALTMQGVSTAEVTRMAVQRGFPLETIIEGVRRRATSREMTIALDATYIVPAVRPVEHGEAGGDSRLEIIEQRPWRDLARRQDAKTADITGSGRAAAIVVDPEELRTETRSDGNLLRYKHAHDALLGDDYSVIGIFGAHTRLAALFPYPQTMETPVSGRAWFARVQVAEKVAKSLGIVGPFSYSSIVAPYRGMAAYSGEFLRKVADRIFAAGGWERLSAIAGGDKALERILDCVAGDIAREEGMYVGIVATQDELRSSWNVMQDVYSRKPIVYPDYVDYPYSGRVVAPTIKNRVGQAIKSVSPRSFDRLYRLQLRIRQTMKGL